ncbi:TPA: galactonate oxidoreductase, partial [Escherichia coli]|nr:galactonate oxidoreductase [Escherichia coli]
KETTLLSSRNATREDFALVIELMRSNKIHENLMKNQAFNFFSVGEDYQRNVVENKNMVKGVITF